MTPLGAEIVKGYTKTQKRIIRQQLVKLKIFELLTRLIKVQSEQSLPEEELLGELQTALPQEKTRPLFRTLLSWGRYAEIISFDQRQHVLRLHDQGAEKPRAEVPSVN